MFLADKDLGNFIRNLYKDGHNDLNNKRHRMRAIDSSLFFEVAFTKINTNGNSQGVAFISNITDKIESEKRKTRDLKTQTTINLLSQTIHDETDYYSLLNTITNHIIHEFEVAKCGIHVFDKEKDGVVVTEVVPGSPAADKNLQVGDILRRFGQRPVKGVAELTKDIEDAEDGGRSGILILIERDGRERFLQIGFAKK